ncbi:MAG: family 43 glycosylhydrolase [Bacteroidales bacterium]|nr:family 43 glycosylhydrolase [Bacteroidales bacterium]
MNRKIAYTIAILIAVSVRAQDCNTNLFPQGKQYYDTYHDVAAKISQWKHYNTHDPTVYKDGEWYYMYSTDASWAGLNKTGALKRRSKDLVNWEFLGNAFNGVPQSAVDYFKNNGNPNYTDQGIWAPFLFKFKNKYLLYYSAPGGLEGVNFAYIGYATSNSAAGPWEDKGMITCSFKDTINAIDPSVIYDSISGKLWMSYGSWFKGIYIVELDTATGGIKTPGDKGKLICNRATPNLGQEGSELCYRNGWYYLFVSYDGLGDIYNVRVGRSRNPEGPYYDFRGKSMASKTDNVPMILSPYRFNNHFGWQGTGHCGVYNDNGKYYLFHQGRPSIEPAMMVLHVREIFWIDDWPVVSPERYAGVPTCSPSDSELYGDWEYLPLRYFSNPKAEFHSTSKQLSLNSDHSFNNDGSNKWERSGDTLFLRWNTGDVDKVIVFRGWDWENNCSTWLFSGLNNNGRAIWGKKVIQSEVQKFTSIVSGATYKIENLCSHLLMNVANNNQLNPNTPIVQNADKGITSQLWRIFESGNGYYYFSPYHSNNEYALSIRNASNTNGAFLVIDRFTAEDKQLFKANYLGNGYYSILSKISNNTRCADVSGFSVAEGGMVIQWDYLGGVNQLWRIERVDSIPIDTLTSTLIHNKPSIADDFEFFPNPVSGDKLYIRNKGKNTEYRLTLYNVAGQPIFNQLRVYDKELAIDCSNLKGIVILRIDTDSQVVYKKIIIE